MLDKRICRQPGRFLVAAMFAGLVGFAAAAEVTAAQSALARQEIAHLFDYLKDSGCQFNRNGSWYQGPEAVAHLNKKYAYLSDKGMAGTAEEFIERAAASSSMSGKLYQVRCAGGAPVDSASWFKDELLRYRKGKR